jgi:hypothetical protein
MRALPLSDRSRTSTRPATSPALLYVPLGPSAQVRFRVLTPEHYPIATTVESALAAAAAMAVARHHPNHYALIAASDGRWLEVHHDGTTALCPATGDTGGWPGLVARALGRLVPTDPTPPGDVA